MLRCERPSVAPVDRHEVEELLSQVTSLSEERDQLKEILEGLREEKNQLRAELEDRMDQVCCLCSHVFLCFVETMFS